MTKSRQGKKKKTLVTLARPHKAGGGSNKATKALMESSESRSPGPAAVVETPASTLLPRLHLSWHVSVLSQQPAQLRRRPRDLGCRLRGLRGRGPPLLPAQHPVPSQLPTHSISASASALTLLSNGLASSASAASSGCRAETDQPGSALTLPQVVSMPFRGRLPTPSATGSRAPRPRRLSVRGGAPRPALPGFRTSAPPGKAGGSRRGLMTSAPAAGSTRPGALAEDPSLSGSGA